MLTSSPWDRQQQRTRSQQMLLIPMGRSIPWCWASLRHAQPPHQPGDALLAACLLLSSTYRPDISPQWTPSHQSQLNPLPSSSRRDDVRGWSQSSDPQPVGATICPGARLRGGPWIPDLCGHPRAKGKSHISSARQGASNGSHLCTDAP